MKKILAAALLSAVSSFATWDYFPIKPAGNGEVKVGVDYTMLDKASGLGINAGARFSVIDGLEIAAMFGFPIMESNDGNSCSDYKAKEECPPSLAQPIIGLRYWLPAGLGIALDVGLPFQGKAAEGGDKGASLSFTPAVQYSAKFTEELELGSEVSFLIPLENGNKRTPNMELGIGLELDYSLGLVTPYVGVDVAMKLTESKAGGNAIGDKKGTGITPGVGAIFNINDTFGADVGVTFGFGEDYFGTDKTTTTISANFSLNF